MQWPEGHLCRHILVNFVFAVLVVVVLTSPLEQILRLFVKWPLALYG